MADSIFKLDLPGGWTDQTVYNFRGPREAERDHQVMLVLTRELQHIDVGSFAKEWTYPLVSTLQGVDILKDEEITIPKGNQAYEFVYRWSPSESLQDIYKYVFVIKNGIGFTFSCQFSKRTLKTVGAGMIQLIESLLPGTYEAISND
jgi:hypothetical protein